MANPAPTASRPDRSDGGGPSHADNRTVRVAGEILAVTARDDFLLELGEALGGQFAVHPAEDIGAALAHTHHARQPQILAIDSRAARSVREDVERARAEAPGTPVVVFALLEEEKSVAGALKGAHVLAVLPLPIERRKTAAVLESGLADAAALRAARERATPAAAPASPAGERTADAARAEPLQPESAALSDLAQFGEREAGRGGLIWLWIAIGVAIVALGGALYWLLGSRATPAPAHEPAQSPAAAPAAAPPSAAVPLVKGTVDDLLEKARGAMRDRRYTEPANDSALLYYRSALGSDPASAEARDGLARLANLLAARFDETLAGDHLDDAAAALAALKNAAPGDPRLAHLDGRLLQAQVTRALGEGNLERVNALLRQAQQSAAVPADQLAKWRAELARHQDDARQKHFDDLIAERIRDGHLIEPASDSARYYVGRLKEVAPAAEAQRATHDLTVALLHRARDAALAGRPADADRWVGEARASGMTPADFASYQHELASARQHSVASEAERLAQLARERLRAGALTEPAHDSASDYLTQLHDVMPNSATLPPLQSDLAARLLARAGDEGRAGQGAAMRGDLALARRWGADPAQVAATEQAASRASRPAGTPATAGGEIQLKRTRYVQPEYPDSALDARQAGTVEVEFTVDTRGRPRDAHVVQSNPPKVFDRAAMRAVEAWRYDPVSVNGTPTEVLTRALIRFQLPPK